MNSGERGVQGAAAANKAASKQARGAFAARLERLKRHCEAGELVAAERLCRQMLETAPGHPRATSMLADILSSQGRHQEAITTLTSLVELHPDAGPAQFQLGAALNAAGRHAEAATRLRRAIELQPRLAGAHSDLGLALDKLGDQAGAIGAYERALSLAPDMAAARANLGAALIKAGKHAGATAHLRRAAAAYPSAADIHVLLGDALLKTGEEAEALRCYERAVALDPKFSAGWIGLGAASRALGRFAESAKAYERAAAIDPKANEARYGLATVRRGIADDGEIERLRRVTADPASGADERRVAWMAMADKLDERGRFDEAFAAALEGNRLARAWQAAANIRYDHDVVRIGVDALMRVFTPQFFAATRGWGDPSETPVFVVGAFRTGSTLVEQICASHSQVHVIGESHDIPELAAHVHRTAPQMERWTAQMFRGLADRRLERLAARAPGKLRVVDKMLDNIFHLGLIAVLFPRARVIFTHRDGRDAALSVFMRHFAREVAYATDLVDAGRRWRETERMCAYWRRCLPLAMHHVQYETLIGDFEAEARRLIAFLGLAWEPACLEFHKTDRAVRTASVWQVRQPLYGSSVGRWRHYADHLEELCSAIGLDPQAPTGARPADIG